MQGGEAVGLVGCNGPRHPDRIALHWALTIRERESTLSLITYQDNAGKSDQPPRSHLCSHVARASARCAGPEGPALTSILSY